MSSAGLAIGSTFVIGAGHALEPGHGITFLGSYAVGERLNIRSVVSLGLSMMTTQFLLLGGMAFVLQSAVNEVEEPRLLEILSIAAPILVIIFGLWLLFHQLQHRKLHAKKCGCDHPERHDPEKPHHPILVGAISGLLPCPTLLAPFMMAGAGSAFHHTLPYISAFVLGTGFVMILMLIILVRAKDYVWNHMEKIRDKIHLDLLSPVLIIVIGITYLVLNLIGVDLHFHP